MVKARPTFTFYDIVKYLVQCRQVKPTGAFGTKLLFFNDRQSYWISKRNYQRGVKLENIYRGKKYLENIWG